MPLPKLRAAKIPAVQMTAGLMVFALAGYVFVLLAGRTLPSGEATLATSLYFLVNIVGPGIFFALEQVASRATSAALVEGGPLDVVARRTYFSGLKLLAAVLAVLALLAPVLGAKTLHGDWPLFAEVLATPIICVHLHMVRGLLAGRQRFGAYAATMALEGGGRLVFCVAAAAAGASRAWIFGLAYIGASAVAALIGYLVLRREPADGMPAPAAVAAEGAGTLGKGLAALALASLFAQLLPNLAPLAVNSRLPVGDATALTFSQAAVVARIPLLLFLPIQAMILPGLTAAAARGDHGQVRAQLRRILALTVAVGAAGAVVFALCGSWVLRTFFGTTQDLSTPTLFSLAASTVVLMAAYALQPTLVALARYGIVMIGWATGSAITFAIAVLPISAIVAAAAGQLAGPTATALILGLTAVMMLRRLGQSSVPEAAEPQELTASSTASTAPGR